jgi:hypothetical protein
METGTSNGGTSPPPSRGISLNLILRCSSNLGSAHPFRGNSQKSAAHLGVEDWITSGLTLPQSDFANVTLNVLSMLIGLPPPVRVTLSLAPQVLPMWLAVPRRTLFCGNAVRCAT